MERKVVIGVAGMPGAGKATVRRIIKRMGYPAVVMGDVIREEAKRGGLEPTPENLGQIMLRLREEEGPAVVAKRCVPKIMEAREPVVLIDGIRSPQEVEEYKRHFLSFTLIAIHTSPEKRFRRLFRRGRSDDPRTWETFLERDRRELSVGLGDVIAQADHMIVNDGTMEQLEEEVQRVLKELVGK